MTLAQLCPHNRLEPHVKGLDGRLMPDPCPGGTLLPPDSLVIAVEEGFWPVWACDALEVMGLRAEDILDALAAVQEGTETVTTFTAFNVHVQEAP